MVESTRRSVAAFLLTAATACQMPAVSKAQEAGQTTPPSRMTVEQVEKERPEAVVTVEFRVERTGGLRGPRKGPMGDSKNSPPPTPILLDAATTLDKKSSFQVILVGDAVTKFKADGVEKPTDLGQHVVQVTGKVQYLPITDSKGVEAQGYRMTIRDPTMLVVNPRAP